MTIPKSKFKNSIPQIRQVAYKVAKRWGKEFAIDELVNEAWLASNHKDEEKDLPLILRTAHLDMLDYVRAKVGRETLKTKKPKYLTNLDTDKDIRDSGNRLDSFLDMKCSVMDEGCEAVDNKDLMDYIISESEPTTKQAQVLRKHFLEGKTLGEVGKELGGIKECTVSTHKKRAIARCRKRFKNMEMLSL